MFKLFKSTKKDMEARNYVGFMLKMGSKKNEEQIHNRDVYVQDQLDLVKDRGMRKHIIDLAPSYGVNKKAVKRYINETFVKPDTGMMSGRYNWFFDMSPNDDSESVIYLIYLGRETFKNYDEEFKNSWIKKEIDYRRDNF